MHRVRGIRVKSVWVSKIDEMAANARRRLAPGVAADEPVDMVTVMEDLDGKSIPLPSGVNAMVKLAVERLPDHVLARTMLAPKLRRIFVGFNEKTYDDLPNLGYARFTAAHEIGHVKLHLTELAELNELPHDQIALARAFPSHPVYEDSEYQADRFAAAFLAPDAGLRLLQRTGRLNENVVMSTFGLARKTAKIRIENFFKAEYRRNRGGNR